MVDWLTLIMIIIITIALIITNIYVLAYFCHPDDKESGVGLLLKIIVIFGLTLAWAQVLLLPLDVSNNRTFGGGINMKLFWYIVYILIIIYVLIIFPISSSFYEADSSWTCAEKLKHSLCCFLITFIFLLVLSLILYFAIGEAQVPVTVFEGSFSNSKIGIEDNLDESKIITNLDDEQTLDLSVSYITYCIAILSFISWFLFALFGGIGLSAVPLDFFHSFLTRPIKVRSSEINIRKEVLLREVETLKLLGEEIKKLEDAGAHKKFFFSKERREYDRKLKEFKAGKMVADEEYYALNAGEEMRKAGNCYLIFYYLLIPLGVISGILTLLWLIQFICSYFYIKHGRPGYPFLSNMFIFFQDHDVAFLAFVFFTVFCLYLLFCLIKGNFKFGVRILCCWSIYPMKKDGTYMNAFLFNISLILIGSCAITQFCADCLTDYVAFTDIDSLFNIQIKYLKFFGFFYKNHIFQYILFVIFILSFIYLICRPKDRVNLIQPSKLVVKEVELK